MVTNLSALASDESSPKDWRAAFVARLLYNASKQLSRDHSIWQVINLTLIGKVSEPVSQDDSRPYDSIGPEEATWGYATEMDSNPVEIWPGSPKAPRQMFPKHTHPKRKRETRGAFEGNISDKRLCFGPHLRRVISAGRQPHGILTGLLRITPHLNVVFSTRGSFLTPHCDARRGYVGNEFTEHNRGG